MNWGTPTSRDWKDSGDLSNVPENGLLGRMAANWSTPRDLASSRPDHPISTAGEKSSKNLRSLNPLFVEWLMGWMRGWTSLALMPRESNDSVCLETELSLFKQRMRSALWSLGLPHAPEMQNDLFA